MTNDDNPRFCFITGKQSQKCHETRNSNNECECVVSNEYLTMMAGKGFAITVEWLADGKEATIQLSTSQHFCFIEDYFQFQPLSISLHLIFPARCSENIIGSRICAVIMRQDAIESEWPAKPALPACAVVRSESETKHFGARGLRQLHHDLGQRVSV